MMLTLSRNTNLKTSQSSLKQYILNIFLMCASHTNNVTSVNYINLTLVFMNQKIILLFFIEKLFVNVDEEIILKNISYIIIL